MVPNNDPALAGLEPSGPPPVMLGSAQAYRYEGRAVKGRPKKGFSPALTISWFRGKIMGQFTGDPSDGLDKNQNAPSIRRRL